MLAPGAALNDLRNLAAPTIFAALSRARARLRSPAAPSPFLFSGLLLAEFRFGASRATRSRRLGRAAAADRRRRFLFRDFRFGATMELGRSGRAMMMTSASPSGGDGGVAGSLSEVQRPTVFFIRWRVVAEESGAAHFGFGGAMRCSTCWPHDGAVAGGAVADFHFSDIPVRGDALRPSALTLARMPFPRSRS